MDISDPRTGELSPSPLCSSMLNHPMIFRRKSPVLAAGVGAPDQASLARPRRRDTSLSHGGVWKALISRYIGAMPPSSDVTGGAGQRIAIAPPPKTPASSAMTAKVGAAARLSQAAAPAARSPAASPAAV